jgi:hypothetical protein
MGQPMGRHLYLLLLLGNRVAHSNYQALEKGEKN